MLFRLLILVIQSKKLTMTQKLRKLKGKLLIVIIVKGGNVIARLKQVDLASKSDIDDLVEKTGFVDKLKNVNRKGTLNETKHLETEKN